MPPSIRPVPTVGICLICALLAACGSEPPAPLPTAAHADSQALERALAGGWAAPNPKLDKIPGAGSLPLPSRRFYAAQQARAHAMLQRVRRIMRRASAGRRLAAAAGRAAAVRRSPRRTPRATRPRRPVAPNPGAASAVEPRRRAATPRLEGTPKRSPSARSVRVTERVRSLARAVVEARDEAARARALARLGRARLPAGELEPLRASLVASLRRRDSRGRRAALAVLERNPLRDLARDVVRLATNDSDRSTRKAAYRTLAAWDSPAALEVLGGWLRSRDARTRRDAVSELARRAGEDPGARRLLQPLLRSPEDSLRRAAERALRR